MSMFSLNANDSQQIGRRIFRETDGIAHATQGKTYGTPNCKGCLHRKYGQELVLVQSLVLLIITLATTSKNTPARPQRNNDVSWETVSVLR